MAQAWADTGFGIPMRTQVPDYRVCANQNRKDCEPVCRCDMPRLALGLEEAGCLPQMKAMLTSDPLHYAYCHPKLQCHYVSTGQGGSDDLSWCVNF